MKWGIDDSYTNEEELHALYRSILKIFIEHGNEVGKKEIEEYLPTLTKKGSGDDVSIALIFDEYRVRELLDIFNIQAELFDLNVSLNEKKHQVDVMLEQYESKHKQWLDSRLKPNEKVKVDVRQINDLGLSIDEKDKEIAKIKEKIDEKESRITSNRRLSIPRVAFFFFLPIPTFSPKTLEVTRKSRIFAAN